MKNSYLLELISFNISSVFYPSDGLKLRLFRKNHLVESILSIWPIYLIYTTIEVIFLFFAKPTIDINFWLVILLLFKSLIFPLMMFFEIAISYFIIRIVLPLNVDDAKINSVIGNTVAANFFLIIPLIGNVVSLFLAKILLFQGVCYFSNWQRGLIAVVLPSILSMFFMLFFFFCLALFSLSLVSNILV